MLEKTFAQSYKISVMDYGKHRPTPEVFYLYLYLETVTFCANGKKQ